MFVPILLILVGAGVIGVASVRTNSIVGMLGASPHLRRWQVLRWLMVFFVVAYLGACWLLALAPGEWLSMMTGVVFLAGAAFVLLVVRLGEVSMRDLEDRRAEAIARSEELAQVVQREKEARRVAEEANTRLARSNKELEQFAYVASHDLQEPLRKVKAFGQLLLDEHGERLDASGQMYVDRMQKAALRMSALIDDLLSYSRASRGEEPIAEVDLQKLLDEVVSDLEVRLSDSGGAVRAERLPRLRARPTQMRQLMQNLVGNALKFSKPGVAPLVTVSAARRTDQSSLAAAWELTFTDNGVGFEPQYAEKIFGIFQRLHGRSEYDGTGVGLAIVQKIVEGHGGSVRAEGRPGEGATFVVQIPEQPRGDAP